MTRKMKNSGVEWIRQVPDAWKLERLSWHLKEINEKNNPIKTTNILSLTNKEGVLPYEDRGNQGNKAKENYDEYKIAYPDTIVANSMNVLIGSVGLCNYYGCVSPVYYVFKARENSNLKFLNYLMQTTEFQKELRRYANGIMEIRLRVSSEDIFKRLVPIPSNEEQAHIADFLDKKVSEIDNVIAKTKESIEEYKKLKQSIITEAVTKGLDSNVEMKESSIEWLHLIPSNWKEMKTLRCLAMPITDGPHETPTLYPEGIPFVSAEAVSCGNGGIDFSHIRGFISKEFYSECCKKYIPQRNDVYMIKSGASTGRVSIVDTDRVFTIWSPLAVFRCNLQKCLPKFIYYALQAEYYQKQVEFGWTFGTQQNIGMRTLEQLKLVVPTITEQKQIIEYLDNQCSKIDEIISKKEQLLTELGQYKKSLIYEYVTGKKEAN